MMRMRTLIAHFCPVRIPYAAALLLAGLLTGCAGSASSPTDAPTLTAAPATTVANVQSYPLDDAHSIIRYQSTLTLGNLEVDGTFNTRGKALTVSTQGSQTTVAIDLQIIGASITSPGNIGVDTFKGMLEIDKYPYAHFIASVSAPTVDLGATPAAENAVGTLEMHGQTRPIQIPVQIARVNGRVSAVGTLSLEMTDFGMVVPGLIKSRITMTADLLSLPLPGTATLSATSAATLAATAPSAS